MESIIAGLGTTLTTPNRDLWTRDLKISFISIYLLQLFPLGKSFSCLLIACRLGLRVCQTLYPTTSLDLFRLVLQEGSPVQTSVRLTRYDPRSGPIVCLSHRELSPHESLVSALVD